MSTARAYAPVSSPGLTWANPATGGAPQRVTERLRLATGVDDLQPPDRAHRPVLLRRPARRPVPRCEHLPGGRRRPPGHPPRGNRHEHRHIQGAHDLAWKLAWVLRGWAAPALLDSYETEFRPTAEHNVVRSADPPAAAAASRRNCTSISEPASPTL